MSAPAVGYWTQTASENWCEADYTHSFYVAEWWNTLSSFPLVIFSLLALRLGLLHGYPKRLLLPSLLTALVGLGSVWFHGTLSYGGQALDELSMVVAATAFLYVGLEADPRAIKLPWLAPALAAWSASFIGAYVYLKDTSYFLFFVVIFALLSTRCCYTAYLLHQRTADPTLRTLFFCGQSLWAAGFLLFWLPDKLVRRCACVWGGVWLLPPPPHTRALLHCLLARARPPSPSFTPPPPTARSSAPPSSPLTCTPSSTS